MSAEFFILGLATTLMKIKAFQRFLPGKLDKSAPSVFFIVIHEKVSL